MASSRSKRCPSDSLCCLRSIRLPQVADPAAAAAAATVGAAVADVAVATVAGGTAPAAFASLEPLPPSLECKGSLPGGPWGGPPGALAPAPNLKPAGGSAAVVAAAVVAAAVVAAAVGGGAAAVGLDAAVMLLCLKRVETYR